MGEPHHIEHGASYTEQQANADTYGKDDLCSLQRGTRHTTVLL